MSTWFSCCNRELTPAELRVYDVARKHGDANPGEAFSSTDLWPERNNQAKANMRTFRRLCEDGAFNPVEYTTVQQFGVWYVTFKG